MARWRTWLIISVTFNVFLVGGIVGALYRWMGDEHAIIAQQHRNIRFAADGLSPQDRRAFIDLLKQQHRDSIPLAKDAKEGRRIVAQLLVAPQFDQQAMEQALDRTRDADVEQRRRLEEVIVTFASTLSLDERIRLAEGLQRRGSFQLPALPASTSASVPGAAP
ncbi:MAG: periplasmic heavy metal sensor [Paraburkholderia tropica]|uniref:periplasmic heavy metal sensor n=1 Tax=Paraburkholderia tropica TaxID=92647 RepID=UPI001620EC69|nr:periplasmic heavy metal sensor [Paraburkholderia tropica]MBB2984763.1 putative membrane protein [Paraburkholderia tropica]